MSGRGNIKQSSLVCSETVTDSRTVEGFYCKKINQNKCVVSNENMSTWDSASCTNCMTPSAPEIFKNLVNKSNIVFTSSNNLSLQRLEQEKQLLWKYIDEKLQIEQDFLQKKYEILQERKTASESTLFSKEIGNVVEEKVSTYFNLPEISHLDLSHFKSNYGTSEVIDSTHQMMECSTETVKFQSQQPAIEPQQESNKKLQLKYVKPHPQFPIQPYSKEKSRQNHLKELQELKSKYLSLRISIRIYYDVRHLFNNKLENIEKQSFAKTINLLTCLEFSKYL